MDKQTFFDQGVCHVFRQGKPAIRVTSDGDIRCSYYAPDGCKCFVGALIPPERYDRSWDVGGGVFGGAVLQAIEYPGYRDTHCEQNFVFRCQGAHDEAGKTYPAGGQNFLAKFTKEVGRIARREDINSFALRGCLAAMSGAFR